MESTPLKLKTSAYHRLSYKCEQKQKKGEDICKIYS